MKLSPLIDNLLQAFQCLPGIGPKSAERMVFHVLERDRKGAMHLAKVLQQAMKQVGHCKRCRLFSEEDYCTICQNTSRDVSKLCVVETPADVAAIEKMGAYRGLYFVLLGHLSPIDGIGPQEIGIDAFRARIEEDGLLEVIMATNPTVEGETTAYYLAEFTKAQSLITTRIAHGVPLGGELEYLDGGTLARALSSRNTMIED